MTCLYCMVIWLFLILDSQVRTMNFVGLADKLWASNLRQKQFLNFEFAKHCTFVSGALIGWSDKIFFSEIEEHIVLKT